MAWDKRHQRETEAVPPRSARIINMPKRFRAEFRRVALKHEAPVSQIAKVFDFSAATLHNRFKNADIEDGARPGVTDKEAAELREAGTGFDCWNK